MHASVSIKTIRLKSERSLKAQIPSWKKKKKKKTPLLAKALALPRYPKASSQQQNADILRPGTQAQRAW